jgi:fission 1 protein
MISLEFQKCEQVYNEQLKKGSVTPKAQFEYAWCLVRSKFSADIKKGIIYLEELWQNGNVDGRREYLYYLAIGNARIKVGVLMFESVNSLLRCLNFVCSVATNLR